MKSKLKSLQYRDQKERLCEVTRSPHPFNPDADAWQIQVAGERGRAGMNSFDLLCDLVESDLQLNSEQAAAMKIILGLL